MPNTCKSNDVAIQSGARESNTWIIFLLVGNNFPKGKLIQHETTASLKLRPKQASTRKLALEDESAAHQLVGRVMAYQG